MRDINWNGTVPYLYGVVLGYSIKGGLSGGSKLWFVLAAMWIVLIALRGPATFDYDTEGKPNA
jgi:hypothetical protein